MISYKIVSRIRTKHVQAEILVSIYCYSTYPYPLPNWMWLDHVYIQFSAVGPLKETLDDFWKMVWEQKSSRIIMVANLMEENRVCMIWYFPYVYLVFSICVFGIFHMCIWYFPYVYLVFSICVFGIFHMCIWYFQYVYLVFSICVFGIFYNVYLVFKLKNYVFELNGFTSVPHDLGHERFFYS